jgi:hypothetical protein
LKAAVENASPAAIARVEKQLTVAHLGTQLGSAGNGQSGSQTGSQSSSQSGSQSTGGNSQQGSQGKDHG